MDININIANENENNIVYLSGEIDVYTAPQVKEQLLPLVQKENQTVIVDFSAVNYMDSTGLGVFISAFKTTRESNSSLQLVNLQDRVHRIFSITGLDEVMNITPMIRGGSEHGNV